MEEHQIARLAPETVKAHLDRGDTLILVDVRRESVYARGHIPGAICLPLTEFGAQRGGLPAATSLVFY